MRSAHHTPLPSQLATVSRVVHRHRWKDLSEWATTLDSLADLTDEQIEEVAANPRAW